MSSRPGDCVTPAADSTPTPLSDSLLGAHSSSVTKSPGDSARRKRSLASSSSSSSSSSPVGNTPAIDNSRNRRKTQKVSRACDFCRIKKLRCNGTLPCNTCVKRNLVCVYAAKYSRGRPPTPPAAVATIRETFNLSQVVPVANLETEIRNIRSGESRASPAPYDDIPSSRSPELDTSEIEGQFFGPTSGLAFLHEVSKRLLAQRRAFVPHILTGGERSQALMTAGDPPFLNQPEASVMIPTDEVVTELIDFYFDACVVTYRMFHRQTVTGWAQAMLSNSRRARPLTHEIGHARASIVLSIFAIVTFRRGWVDGREAHETAAQADSDRYFCAGLQLTEAETGLPGLVSAQARLIQVLYLLQTAHMNQAWYQFGIASQVISALGLHRRSRRKRNGVLGVGRGDYIEMECGKRTFWVAYTIDRYLSVVFGRPRQYHDEDIDQSFPESINDESMTAQGPSGIESLEECHVDALIFHAKLAQIIGVISRDVYSVKRLPKDQRINAAHQALLELHKWRSELPPHLGTVRPSSLIPIFRRQAIALKLAYSHAIIHASRPFLLGRWGNTPSEIQIVHQGIDECISAAKIALMTFDNMASDGRLLYAFWWTPYVAFCALAVVYILDIQKSNTANRDTSIASHGLSPLILELAEKCRGHLSSSTASNTPNQRYSIILEELRNSSRQQHIHSRSALEECRKPAEPENNTNVINAMPSSIESVGGNQFSFQKPINLTQQQDGIDFDGVDALLSGWQTTDWLELDSSALGPFNQFDMEFL